MLNSKTKILSTVLITSYLLLITVNIASAAGIVPCGGQGEDPCTICHLFIGINNLVQFLAFYAATPIAVIVIIYGAFMWITAAGSETNIEKGKTAIKMAVLGIVIAFAGVLIVDTIIKALVDPENFLQFWKKGMC